MALKSKAAAETVENDHDDHPDSESTGSFEDEEAGEGDTHQSGQETSNSASSLVKAEKEKIAQRESKHVLFLRLLVCLVLGLAAVAVSVVVYSITANSEQEQFEAQYLGAAAKISGTLLLLFLVVIHTFDISSVWSVTNASFLLSYNTQTPLWRLPRRNWELREVWSWHWLPTARTIP